MKLSTKTLMIFSVVAVSVVIMVMVFVLGITRTMLQDSIGKNRLIYAEHILHEVDRFLYERFQSVQSLSQDYSLAEILSAEGGPWETKSLVMERLKKIKVISGPWNSVFLLDRDGKIVIDINNNDDNQFINKYTGFQELYDQALLGQVVYSDFIINPVSLQPTVIFAAPVRDKNQYREILGVLITQLSWPAVTEILEVEEGQSYLYDEIGNVIASNKGQKSEKEAKVFFDNYDNMNEVAHNDIIYNHYEQTEYTVSSVIEQGYLDYKGNNWILKVALPVKQAYALATVTALKVGVMILFIALILLLGSFFLILRYIVWPISTLTKGVEKMSNRDLNQVIDINSSDEIGHLAKGFNDMAQKLRLFYNDLEKIIRQRSRQLEHEKDKLAIILDSMAEGALAIDKKGKVIIFNRIAVALTGFKSSEAIGKNYKKSLFLFDKHEDILNYKFINESIKKKKIVSNKDQIELVTKDGTVVPIAVIAAPILCKNKKSVLGSVIIFRDITRELEVQQMKDDFISLASHQLRTPLTGIKWALEILIHGNAGKLNLNKQQDKFLRDSYKSTQRLTQLVNSLLNFSRIEGGYVGIETSKFLLDEFCDNLLADFRGVLKVRKQKFKYTNKAKKLEIVSDVKLLREILANFISNALKYSPEKSTIELRVEKDRRGVQISVKDQGFGIPKEQQSKIFSKFFRADNIIKVETTGSGLGLAITKNLVKLLRGKIWFKSIQNKGTTFFVSFPLKIRVKSGIKDNKELIPRTI